MATHVNHRRPKNYPTSRFVAHSTTRWGFLKRPSQSLVWYKQTWNRFVRRDTKRFCKALQLSDPKAVALFDDYPPELTVYTRRPWVD